MSPVRFVAALSSLLCVAAMNAGPPDLIVERAERNQFWSSAVDAPVYLSTAPADHLTIWNARDGTLERTLALPHQATPWAYAESPAAIVSSDGRLAAVRIGEDRIAMVRIADGDVVPLSTSPTGTLFPLALSPDDSALAVDVIPPPDPRTGQPQIGHIDLIAVADGRTLRTFRGDGSATFSPDGRELATLDAARDRLLLFDLGSNRVTALSDGGGVYGPIAFSPDGATVATGGDDPSIPPRGDGTFDSSSTAHELVVKLWDVRGRRLRSRFPGRRTWQMNPLDERAGGTFAFADASTLAVRSDSAVTLYESKSLRAANRIEYGKAGSPDVFRVAGALGFVVNHGETLSFDRWTGQTNVSDATVPFIGGFGNSVLLEPSARSLVIAAANGPNSGVAYRLDLRSLELIKLPLGPTNATSPYFLSDGRLAFLTSSEAAFIDMHAGTIARHPVPSQQDPKSYVYVLTSGDGQTLFAAQPTIAEARPESVRPARAYDTATGKGRFALPDVTRVPDACSKDTPRCAFIGDGSPNRLPSDVHAPLALTVIDSRTGRRVSHVSLPTRRDGAGFIDSGRRLAVRGQAFTRMQGDSVTIVDPERGTVERSFATVDGRLAFSDSGPYVALVNSRSVTVYDSGGRLVQTIADEAMADANAVAFWPGGAKLAILRSDGTVAVRATESGQLLATFAFFVNGDALEWLAYTPDDYFAGSPLGIQTIRWRVGAKTSANAEFDAHFHRPDRVAAALR